MYKMYAECVYVCRKTHVSFSRDLKAQRSAAIIACLVLEEDLKNSMPTM